VAVAVYRGRADGAGGRIEAGTIAEVARDDGIKRGSKGMAKEAGGVGSKGGRRGINGA